jgi:hypothetical protein
MEWIVAGGLLIILGAIIITYRYSEKPEVIVGQSPTPPAPKPNDKCILISGAPQDVLRKEIQAIRDRYDASPFFILIKMSKISAHEFMLTFPADIDFEMLCYLVNALHYGELPQGNRVRAWLTLKPNDEWVTDAMAHKQAMLFIPAFDDEYDNVYLTTSEGMGYKMGFALGETSQLLSKPAAPYEPRISLEINHLPSELIA